MRCVTNVKIRLSRDPDANGFGKGIVQLLGVLVMLTIYMYSYAYKGRSRRR